MDNGAISRRQANNKGNKENTQPGHRTKAFIKRDKTSVVPFQLKGNQKEETLSNDGLLKAQDKQVYTRPVSWKNPKKVTDGRGAVVSDVKRKTHSQVFLSEQAVRYKKTVREAPKPPAAVSSSKPAPGMYKGKVVQSKIGSIWKSSDTVASADLKPSGPKKEQKMVGSVAKNSVPKSAAEMSGRGRGIQNSATTRYKSVSDRSVQVPKSTANTHRPAGVCSARPPTRTIPAASVTAGPRNTNVAALRPSGNQGAKPKAPVTDKVKKPAASSSLSQYRLSMETAEERRAKLAEWLASKGKALKRPAMKTAGPTKTNVSVKTEADLKPYSHAESHLAEYCKPEPEASEEAQKPDPAVSAHCNNVHEAEQTAEIMNTTLDLLENSHAGLPDDSPGGVDDIVVNLCDALEAMAIPLTCSDDDVETESRSVNECEKEPWPEVSEDVAEKPKVEHVKNEERSDQKVEDEEESDESVLEPSSPMTDASVIKYSVKTTPYLQSVKKTIEEEINTSTSRRASNIKDLKFLTPVRRSTRILRKSSRLPTMLVDHDPCVSSLAELVKLDEDSNAYIYRKNPALLDDLPDQDNV
ncbi:cytoskeleton-associated protein 2 [Xenentodon cancila]